MKNKRRLFLAIDLPSELKERLADFKERWDDFPGKWVETEILHITFAFLGDVNEEHIPKLHEVIKGALTTSVPPDVTVSHISYGPGGGRSPRLIQAHLEENKKLSLLYKNFHSALQEIPFKVYKSYKEPSHITLCRFNSMHLRKWHENELPPLEEEIDYTFTVSEVQLIESHLRRGGPEYFVLQSYKLAS